MIFLAYKLEISFRFLLITAGFDRSFNVLSDWLCPNCLLMIAVLRRLPAIYHLTRTINLQFFLKNYIYMYAYMYVFIFSTIIFKIFINYTNWYVLRHNFNKFTPKHWIVMKKDWRNWRKISISHHPFRLCSPTVFWVMFNVLIESIY